MAAAWLPSFKAQAASKAGFEEPALPS